MKKFKRVNKSDKGNVERCILDILRQVDCPLTINDIKRYRLFKKNSIKNIKLMLQKLVDTKLVKKSNNHYYWLDGNKKIIFANVVKVNKTFGFVKIIGTDEEIFIPGRYMIGILPGDKVIIKKLKSQKGNLLEGKVLVICDLSDGVYLGRVVRENGKCFFSSNKVNFLLKLNDTLHHSVCDNQLVKVKVVKRGKDNDQHVAEVVSVLGDAYDPESCCRLVLAQNGVKRSFGAKTLEEAKKMAQCGIDREEYKNRLDLTDEVIFTIDGEDSKDLDDAVSIEKLERGCWKLGVHIADVSHYVNLGSELDKEACERGTSVYYADSVVPMLPQELSNGICSLNQQEDRLAFSVLMILDQDGNIKSYSFKKSVIKSRIKGVYSEINQILGDCETEEVKDKYKHVRDEIFLMKELSDLLMKKRFERGSLNLETQECKIKVGKDVNGHVNEQVQRGNKKVDIVTYKRGFSEEIIEEFMLKANEAAALFAQDRNLPFIYRIHESPPSDKLFSLSNALINLNLPRPKNSSQFELSKVIESAKDTKLKFVVNNLILRSLSKAKYSSEYKPHYGLVLDNYSHFTSPIRRYPDLMIHRIMSKVLECEDKGEKFGGRYFENIVAQVAVKSSECERKADNVERQCEDIYKAYYMSDFIGQGFDAVVSSITQHGFYVQLSNTVEGLVNKNALPNGEYEIVNMVELKNLKDNDFSIKIGDQVNVKLVKTDVFSGQIDFELIC